VAIAQPLAEDSAIVTAGLRVTRGNVEILRGIDLNIHPGEFVSIVGRSGTGKTTLLLALLGYIPHTGTIHVPSHIGVVLQQGATFPWLTTRANIDFGLHGMSPPLRKTRVNELLALTGLTGNAGRYPWQLSGGETQRVALARALAPDPPALFMDEPLGALDLLSREDMQNWLVRVFESQRKTVLFVTHSIEEAVFLSDRVVTLAKCCVTADIHVPFTRPRPASLKFDPSFLALKQQVLESLDSQQVQTPRR